MARIDETACARLCLLTRAALSEDIPLLTRSQVSHMLASGALSGLVLREVPDIPREVFTRACALLSRVRAVYDCMRVYEESGYRLITPEHPLWPPSLRSLGRRMPLFLFCWGNDALLEKPRLSVAGSRRILPETRHAAELTGRQIVQEGYVLVSGGATGVDSAAQRAALTACGEVILVPALPAARLLQDTCVRAAVTEERVLILCDALPDEPFSTPKALGRNHTIYALGRAALVVAAREGHGGSWHGATDCLHGGFAPVYVWNGDNEDTTGNRALHALGAKHYDLSGRETLSEQLGLL